MLRFCNLADSLYNLIESKIDLFIPGIVKEDILQSVMLSCFS